MSGEEGGGDKPRAPTKTKKWFRAGPARRLSAVAQVAVAQGIIEQYHEQYLDACNAKMTMLVPRFNCPGY